MALPARSASTRPLIHQLRRWGFIVLAVDFVLLGVMGAWLTFGYEPGATLSTVHNLLGVVAVLAALVAAVATVADAERSTAGVLPAVVVLTAVAGMYLIGPTLAWDGLVADGELSRDTGVVAAFDDDVQGVTIGTEQVLISDYRTYAWLHILALPAAVAAMGAAGMWAMRRRRNQYVPRRAAED